MSQDAKLIRDALAERLGLALQPSGDLAGTLEGAPLRVKVSVIRQNHGHGQVVVFDASTSGFQSVVTPLQLRIEVSLPFEPRLDAGLGVAPAGGHASLSSAGRVGAGERLVVAKGADPERAAHLLTAEVLDRLDRSFVGDPGPRITDGGVSWAWVGAQPWPPIDELARAIAEVPPVWSALRAAAKTAPPAPAVADAFVVLSGMDLLPGVEPWGCPAGVVGAVDGVPVSVSVAPFHTGGWLARAAVRLPAPIPGQPKVLREAKLGWFDRLAATLGGRPEIEVGDAAFDRRFAVRSLKPEALVEVLDADVRKAMLALDGLIPIELGPTAIEGHGPVKRDKELVSVVQATLALARFVGRASR